MDTRKDLPVIGACLSLGSLKTEEKTERQCGQSDLMVGLHVNSMHVG